MKIIIDAMGGDNAPDAIVKGAVLAVAEYGLDVVLVGNKDEIKRVQNENNLNMDRIEIVHTDKTLTMEDEATSILKEKRDTSMGKSFDLLAGGEGDALVSAGNTGAILTGATLIIKRISGIKRAAIGVVLPFENKTLLIDAGANKEFKGDDLRQFGIMGSIYMRSLFNIENPTVGLANNGSEKTKGTSEHVEAYKLLSESRNINFIGNIEGRDIPIRSSDVLVCDGFTGNMILKLTEGFGLFMNKKFKKIFFKDVLSKVAALIVKNELVEFRKSLDQSEYGGAPLFGVKKPVIKAHGSSDATAVKNAIRQAKICIESNIIEEIEKNIK